MANEDPFIRIRQLENKTKRQEKRIEEVREELLKNIGVFQAQLMILSEEVSKKK